MNTDAYIEGFVKRASEYGITTQEAMELLKASAELPADMDIHSLLHGEHRYSGMGGRLNNQLVAQGPMSQRLGAFSRMLKADALHLAEAGFPAAQGRVSNTLGNITRAGSNVMKGVEGVGTQGAKIVGMLKKLLSKGH